MTSSTSTNSRRRRLPTVGTGAGRGLTHVPFSFSKPVFQFLSRLWNCAHEFERPPAHVQVRDADAPMITYPPSNIPFCPMAPPLARSFPLTVSSPCFCLPRWHPTESSSSPLAYPIPVAPFSATSTDDRGCSVVCQRNAAFDITRIPLVPFDIFQIFNVPALVSDTVRRSLVHRVLRLAEVARSERSSDSSQQRGLMMLRGSAANDTSRARVSSGPHEEEGGRSSAGSGPESFSSCSRASGKTSFGNLARLPII